MPTTITPATDESRLAKALAHPLRARILAEYREVNTPADIAEKLDAPLGVVSYHTRMLRDYQCIELIRTEPRRGALQHFYRATVQAPRVMQGTIQAPTDKRWFVVVLGFQPDDTIDAELLAIDLAAVAERGDPVGIAEVDHDRWQVALEQAAAAAIDQVPGGHGA